MHFHRPPFPGQGPVHGACSKRPDGEAGEILEQKLRQTDYIGILDGGLHVLLSNTDEENAKGVILRFGEEGLKSILVNREVAA